MDRKSKRGLGIGAWAAVAVLSSGAAWAADAPRKVHVISLSDQARERQEWVPASVFATQEATLSTRIAAAVAAVPVQEGDRVKKGELLVRLDAKELRAQVSAAKASYETARLNEQRAKTLLAARAVPQTAVDSATAQRAQAEAALQLAKSNLAYAELRAPFDGRVQKRHVLGGDFVSPGQPLISIQGDALELHASLSEAQAASLKLGQRLPFTAGSVKGEAALRSLTPGSDALAHRRGLIATVVSGKPLRAGDFARIAVPSDGQVSQLEVPNEALVQRGDLDGVFVVEDGKAHLRWLSLGERDGDAVAVRAGLRPGEKVVMDPGELRDADPVEVADVR